jgi:MOSC domain-containing protein YiiM
MKVLSVNIGKKQKITWRGKTIETGIYKKPVDTSIFLEKEDVKDDCVADRKHHGGKDMAVYAFTKNHYEYFQKLYPNLKLSNGIFGENLTVSNLFETEIQIGDTFQVGKAIIQVSQPRMPCYKLGIVFGTQKIVKQYLNTTYCGFYFRVLKNGKVKKDDKFVLIEKAENSMTMADAFSLFTTNKNNQELIKKALAIELLSERLKKDIRRKLLR